MMRFGRAKDERGDSGDFSEEIERVFTLALADPQLTVAIYQGLSGATMEAAQTLKARAGEELAEFLPGQGLSFDDSLDDTDITDKLSDLLASLDGDQKRVVGTYLLGAGVMSMAAELSLYGGLLLGWLTSDKNQSHNPSGEIKNWEEALSVVVHELEALSLKIKAIAAWYYEEDREGLTERIEVLMATADMIESEVRNREE